MFQYRTFALNIHSEVEMPHLCPGGKELDVIITRGSVPRERRTATLLDEIALNKYTGGFHITGGREIVVDSIGGADPELLSLMLSGRIMAYLLRQRGMLALHASGVAIDGNVVLFLGTSGAGKSTAAAAFYAAGHHVVTDDIAAVKSVGPQSIVHPAGGRLRLFEESLSAFGGSEPAGVFQFDKHTFHLKQDSPPQLPLSRIYLLEYGDRLKCEAIGAAAAVELLSRHSFVRRHKLDQDSLAGHLSQCAAVVRNVPVLRLFRERSLTRLPDLIQWVQQDVASHA
jgi:hypothetical protein